MKTGSSCVVGAGVLEAAALVDGDVDEHRAGLHPADQVVAHELGRLGAGDEHRADDEVGVEAGPLDLVAVARDGLHVALVDPVHLAQPGDVEVEQQHLGLHAERDRGGVEAGDAGAEHDDLRGVHAGDAAHEHAAAALRPLEEVRPGLRGHPAGDLGHRREQRQRAVRQLHRLVRDGRRAAGQERVGAAAGTPPGAGR